MFLFQFIPPPSFSPPLHPSPIYSPLLFSPGSSHPPDKSIFLPSLYSPLHACTHPLFCLVSRSSFSATSHQFKLHAALYKTPLPPSPLPPPHSLFKECRPSIQPLLLIITQFHSGGGLCMSEYNCSYVCSWTRCDGNSLYCQQTGEGGGI